MKLQDIQRLLQLASPDEILSEAAPRPAVLAWFVDFKRREAIAKRLDDANLAHQWRQPLRTSNQPGHFVVPVVLKQSERWPLASPAFLLPLEWVPGDHFTAIPKTLSDVADQVVECMRQSPRLLEQLTASDQQDILSQAWGLRWSPAAWEHVDLSAASLSPESAWAPLAIGFASAVLQQVLDADLFATGHWDATKNLWQVGPETLPDKLNAGLGAGKTLFVVPSQNVPRVDGYLRTVSSEQVANPPITIGLADSNQGDLYEGVMAAVMQAGLEPDVAAPKASRVDYYLTRGTNQQADDFYRRNLLNSIAAERRSDLERSKLKNWQPEHLVSIVSNSDVLIQLAVLIFRPKQLHLIYTRDGQVSFGMHKRFMALENWLMQEQQLISSGNMHEKAIDDDLLELPELAKYVANLSRGAGRTDVLVDATPGKRAMSLAMLEGVKKGDRVLCWWHDTHKATRRPIPFSEKVLLWQTESGGALRRLEIPEPVGDIEP